jgi:hypothetical protein
MTVRFREHVMPFTSRLQLMRTSNYTSRVRAPFATTSSRLAYLAIKEPQSTRQFHRTIAGYHDAGRTRLLSATLVEDARLL